MLDSTRKSRALPGFFVQREAYCALIAIACRPVPSSFCLASDSSPALPYGPIRTRYTVLPLICADSTRAARPSSPAWPWSPRHRRQAHRPAGWRALSAAAGAAAAGYRSLPVRLPHVLQAWPRRCWSTPLGCRLQAPGVRSAVPAADGWSRSPGRCWPRWPWLWVLAPRAAEPACLPVQPARCASALARRWSSARALAPVRRRTFQLPCPAAGCRSRTGSRPAFRLGRLRRSRLCGRLGADIAVGVSDRGRLRVRVRLRSGAKEAIAFALEQVRRRQNTTAAIATPATSHTHPGVPWLLLRRAWFLPRRAAMGTASPDATFFRGADAQGRGRWPAPGGRAGQGRLALRSAASSTSTGVP